MIRNLFLVLAVFHQLVTCDRLQCQEIVRFAERCKHPGIEWIRIQCFNSREGREDLCDNVPQTVYVEEPGACTSYICKLVSSTPSTSASTTTTSIVSTSSPSLAPSTSASTTTTAIVSTSSPRLTTSANPGQFRHNTVLKF